jgi:DNA-binding MarR family transcriptional regulator
MRRSKSTWLPRHIREGGWSSLPKRGHAVVDDLAIWDLGLHHGMVFSLVVRHQRMRHRVCKASQQRIAELSGLSRQTVNTILQDLVEHGYLWERTPDVRHRPKEYVLTDLGWTLVTAVNDADEQDRALAPHYGDGHAESDEDPEGEEVAPAAARDAPAEGGVVALLAPNGLAGVGNPTPGCEIADTECRDSNTRCKVASHKDTIGHDLGYHKTTTRAASEGRLVSLRSTSGPHSDLKGEEPRTEARRERDPDKLFGDICRLMGPGAPTRLQFDEAIEDDGYGKVADAVMRASQTRGRTWRQVVTRLKQR